MKTSHIFISHITEETRIAEKLKEWIEVSFLGQVLVFVSTNISDSPVGNQWFSTIEAALSNSAVCVVLCSKKSVERPWINFESGAAWIKKIPIIPITYGGMTKENLPIPLLFFQAENTSNLNFSKILIDSISNHLGFKIPPRISHTEMQKEIEEVIHAVFSENTFNLTDDEFGIFDHMVQAEECLGKVATAFTQISEQANLLTAETNEATAGINLAKSGGSARHLQKLARSFSEKVDVRSKNIEQFVKDYNDNIRLGVDSTSYVIKSKKSPLTENDKEEIRNILKSITNTKSVVFNNIGVFYNAALTVEGVPNMERHLRRSTLNLSVILKDLSEKMKQSVLLLESLQATAISQIES